MLLLEARLYMNLVRHQWKEGILQFCFCIGLRLTCSLFQVFALQLYGSISSKGIYYKAVDAS